MTLRDRLRRWLDRVAPLPAPPPPAPRRDPPTYEYSACNHGCRTDTPHDLVGDVLVCRVCGGHEPYR